ncbi:MAG: SUF system Fe-S cluster assembly regulator [Rhodospirillales bacterium]|nr:SUF system Fe-S cluster assembly regulator [Rhodospirillales bacterium]MDE2198305.1 SUF system Fe-S cluster assembly regulator [Rhodospirillales bacterium]MDE3174778.1 SUF system Fe-S cluster assembly regulator [Pseudomonadota bacterium]
MLRLSKLTDYAVVVLIRLEEGQRGGGDGMQTSPGIAQATGVPEPTVAKVLKALTTASMVASLRGARGGYRLLKPLAGISVADVIAAIDGPIALTACVDGNMGSCDVQGMCAVKGRWDLVNSAMLTALSSITLADMRAASVPPAFRIADRAAGSRPVESLPPEALPAE